MKNQQNWIEIWTFLDLVMAIGSTCMLIILIKYIQSPNYVRYWEWSSWEKVEDTVWYFLNIYFYGVRSLIFTEQHTNWVYVYD